MPKGPTRLLPLLPATLVSMLSACVTPTVTASSVGCAVLLPTDWRQGVPGADLPTGQTVGDWIAFGDAQTGRLDMANGRTKDAIGIVERCEARDAKAVDHARKGFFGRIFG